MSRATTVVLEVLGVLLVLGSLAAGYALFKDGTTDWKELAGVGLPMVFGALLVEPKRVIGPLSEAWAAYKAPKGPTP